MAVGGGSDVRLRAKQRSVVGNGSGGVMSLTAVSLTEMLCVEQGE